MLNEHEQGRKLVARLKDPVAGYISENKVAAAGVQLTANEYVALLTHQIAKEDTVLFPMVDTGRC